MSRAESKLPLSPLLLSFLCVGANGLAGIAADTVFLSSFSLGELSRLIGVSAAIRVVLAFGYAGVSSRLEQRRGPSSVVDFGVVFSALSISVLGALALASSARAVHYAVCLLALTVPSLLPLVAFNATTEGLDARHAKRLLPLVAAAATVGAICIGAVAGPIAKVAGPAGLFWSLGLLSVAVLPTLRVATRRAQPSVRPADSLAAPVSASAALRTPAVRVVVGFALFGSMATAFVDFAFKAALKARFEGAELTEALGIFATVSNVLVLLLQLFGTGRIVARLGVGRAILVGPMVLAALSSAAFALPALLGASLTRLGELVVRYGVGNSLLDVLLVPLKRSLRSRAKVLVKGIASPAGAVAAGLLLSIFGEQGPPYPAQVGFVLCTAFALYLVVRAAPAAYAEVLTQALAKDRTQLEVSPEAALVFRASLRGELERFVEAGNAEKAEHTLELMTDRFFTVADVAPAFWSAHEPTRRAAVMTALRLLGPNAGEELLQHAPPDDSAELEALILRSARERNGLANEARLRAALKRTDSAHSGLFVEASLCACLRARGQLAQGVAGAQNQLDLNLKALRKVVRDGRPAQQAAALDGLGVLGDRRAERDVLQAMSSKERAVFREAARAAVLLDAPGAVGALISRLTAGPFAGEATRALALAGPRAVGELVLALPFSSGEGAIAATAVAESRTMSGSVRAARALARIGDTAARSVLPRFGEIGHRARMALARSLGLRKAELPREEREQVFHAIRIVRSYGAELLLQRVESTPELLRSELDRRLSDSVTAILDLMRAIGQRTAIERARVALRDESARANALEFVETVLPAPLGTEVSEFIAKVTGARAAAKNGSQRPLEGWLDKVSKYCAQELPSSEPMAGVLDRVLLLKQVGLFQSLSGEELYPVAEIATLETFVEGQRVVEQGASSDALFVVVSGSLEVIKDGQANGTLGPKQTFGELGVLDAAPRAATVEARSTCELLRVPREELEALLDESPELSKAIIRTLLGYLRTPQSPRG